MIMTTTNTTTTNTTTTNDTNTTNNTTAQQQQPTTTTTTTTEQQQQMRLRDRWEDRVTDALFRQLKRKIRAANALFGTPEWVSVNQNATWFMPHHEEDVTRHAALVEECLDDARAHAKRKGRALRSSPPSSICRAPSSRPRRWSPI